jgi:hypothetical protein
MTKNDGRKKLTRLQRAAVQAIVETRTAKEAAALANCSESSVYKWLQMAHFRAAVAEHEAMIRDAIRQELASKATYALTVIGGVMTGQIKDTEDTRASVRLRAALGWMDLVTRTGDQADLERRVSALEARDDRHEQ